MIYMLTRTDPIRSIGGGLIPLSIIGSIVCIVTIVVTTIIHYSEEDETTRKNAVNIRDRARYYFKWLLGIWLVGTSITTFIPTMKECCAIIVIPAICNNENVKNISQEFYEIALEWMKELHPDNVKKTIGIDSPDGNSKKK